MAQEPTWVPVDKRMIVEAITRRDPTDGPMPVEELMERLDIILSVWDKKESDRARMESLRGALLRMAQFIDQAEVTKRIERLVYE